jgi:hypothetical protein
MFLVGISFALILCDAVAPLFKEAAMKPKTRVLRAVHSFLLPVLIWTSASVALSASGGYDRECESPLVLYTYTRYADPARTVVTDEWGQWVATFADGCRTVTVVGPARILSEPDVTATVTTPTYVRVYPTLFDGTVDESWLASALVDQNPDVLQLALQYVQYAPALYDGLLKIAGDADYGPLLGTTRQEGSDFNDYLGVPWAYGSVTDNPESDQINCLDCSGFMRMVWGYRSGLPMVISPDGTSIPRRSFEILASAPGIVTIPNTGVQVTDLSRLSTGDLVFFDASTDDGTQIDHVGMYLGVDSSGRYRFVSSRKTPNGPTMGDVAAKSILDGSYFYARSFRAARRF